MEEPRRAVGPYDPTVVYLVHEMLVIIPEWTQPYIAYFLQQELHEDEVEAHQIVRRSKAFAVMGDQLYKKSTTGVS